MIKKIHIKNFTVFKDFTFHVHPGINLILGPSGIGKTHLLKVIFSMLYASNTVRKNSLCKTKFIEDAVRGAFIGTFLPRGALGSLIRDPYMRDSAEITITMEDNREVGVVIHNDKTRRLGTFEVINPEAYRVLDPTNFIPTKEVIEGLLGFSSLAHNYVLSFDLPYIQTALRLELPPLRDERINADADWARREINRVNGGVFEFHGSGIVTFRNARAEYSANCCSEGARKLGQFARLLEVGEISPEERGTLLWDNLDAGLDKDQVKLLVSCLNRLVRFNQQTIAVVRDAEPFFDHPGTYRHVLQRDETTDDITADTRVTL